MCSSHGNYLRGFSLPLCIQRWTGVFRRTSVYKGSHCSWVLIACDKVGGIELFKKWYRCHFEQIRETIRIILAIFSMLAFGCFVFWFCGLFKQPCKRHIKPTSSVKVSFESVMLCYYSYSPVSCSWMYGDTIMSPEPTVGTVGIMSKSKLYSYPSFPLAVTDSNSGSKIAGCVLLVDNKPADCSVYLDSDNTLSASADFDCSDEQLGILGGRVRFSGLTYGKNYVFDGKRLDVQEDGTAVGEFNSTDSRGEVYYIPLLEINAGEQTSLLEIGVKGVVIWV